MIEIQQIEYCFCYINITLLYIFRSPFPYLCVGWLCLSLLMPKLWKISAVETAPLTPRPLDPFAKQQMIENYTLYCPYIDQCSKQSSLPYASVLDSAMRSCCEPCSCSYLCHVTGHCCPDHIENMTEPTAIIPKSVSKYECTSSRLKEVVDIANTDYFFLMISKCSEEYHDIQTKKRCEDPYSYDIVNDIFLVNPVESSAASALFRNKYCARCNFVPDDITLTTMWNPWLICEDTDEWISPSENILDFIMSNDRCNVVFSAPDTSTMMHTKCDKGVDVWGSCNISGRWDVYDPFIDAWCNAFTSYYWEMPAPSIMYRNVFCFLCNIDSRLRPQTICDSLAPGSGHWQPASFTALLDFNQKITPGVDGSTEKCQGHFVIDIYKVF